MTVRAQESQVLSQIVEGITIDVIHMQDERATAPAVSNATAGAGTRDANLSECSPEQVWLGP